VKSTLSGRWWRSPQNVWARRALFQIHLWTGIASGIYIFVISVSGSALVFRNELHKSFLRPPVVVQPTGNPLTDDELKAVAGRAYPGWKIENIWRVKNPNQAVEIWFDRNNKHKQRIFNPYTGADLGTSDPAGVRFVLWLADFHDNLLYQDAGRKVNGAGAILLTVLCITGAIVWWPGIASVRRSLVASWTGNWKRFNWGLHSVVGFWTFVLVLIWGVSGIYLVFPDPFTAVIDYLQPDEAQKGLRAGDEVLRWVARLHFGRFAGWPIKTLWFVLGFAPVVLFITGTIMWWNRVISPLLARESRNNEISAVGAVYDRAYFHDSTKSARSQTAPTDLGVQQ
jgi:uncharacterized iron-regulated membrane protein